jgi:hypothetical protein
MFNNLHQTDTAPVPFSLDFQLKMTLDEYDVADAIQAIPQGIADLRETYQIIMLETELDAWKDAKGSTAAIIRDQLRRDIREAEATIDRAEREARRYCAQLAAYVKARDAQKWQASQAQVAQ